MRFLTSVFAALLASLVLALPVAASEMGDDGLHKETVVPGHVQGYVR